MWKERERAIPFVGHRRDHPSVEPFGVEGGSDRLGRDPAVPLAGVRAAAIVRAREVGDPGAVRRPDRGGVHAVDLIRLTAREGDSCEPGCAALGLRIVVAAARLETQDAAVGRPAGRACVARRVAEPERCTGGPPAAQLLHPDLPAPPVPRLVDRGDGERDECAIGRDRHIADAHLAVVVGRHEAAALRRGGRRGQRGDAGGGQQSEHDDAETLVHGGVPHRSVGKV